MFYGAPELCTGEVEDCLSPEYGSTPSDEIDDDGDGYVECIGFIGVGWEGDPNVIGGNDCDDRATDNNGDGDPDGIYTFKVQQNCTPMPLHQISIFASQIKMKMAYQTVPACRTIHNREAPLGYYCEYGIFLDTGNLSTTGAVGPDFVYIPSGEDPDGRYELSQSFYMMTTEVTREMYVKRSLEAVCISI